MNSIGVKAEFQPINDLVVRGKKISGASQSRMYDGVLHHGTISVNTHLDVLEQVLKSSELKLKAQGESVIFLIGKMARENKIKITGIKVHG